MHYRQHTSQPKEKKEWREPEIRKTERQKELIREKAPSNNISQNTSAPELAWKVISLDIAAPQTEIRARWTFYCQASLTLIHTPKILYLETGSSHLSQGKREQNGWEPASSIRFPLPLEGFCSASLALPTRLRFTWLLDLDWAVSTLHASLSLKGPLLIKVTSIKFCLPPCLAASWRCGKRSLCPAS